MTYLLTQLYVWMAFACVLGFVAGWLICSRRWSRKLEEQRERYRQHMARLEMDLRRVDDNGVDRNAITPSADPESFLVGDETDDIETFEVNSDPKVTVAAAVTTGVGVAAAALSTTQEDSVSVDADQAHRPPPEVAKPVISTVQAAAALPEPESSVTAPAWAARVANCEKDIAILQKQMAALDKPRESEPTAEAKAVPQPAVPSAELAAMPAYGLTGPKGDADDLKRIWGVGPKLESMLNDLGIYHFAQIAGFTDEDITNVSEQLDQFADRITRDNWIEQASKLIG